MFEAPRRRAATSVLLAVTTGIPLSREDSTSVPGRIEPAEHFDDHVNARRDHVCRVSREPEPRPRSALPRIAHQRIDAAQIDVRGQQLRATSIRDLRDGLSDAAVSEQPDAYHAPQTVRLRPIASGGFGRQRPDRSFTCADFVTPRSAETHVPLPGAGPFLKVGSATTTRRSARAAASTRLRNAIYRGNEECCRLRRNRPRFIFPGIGQEVAPGRLPPGCCGVVGPVPSATRDKCLRHAQTYRRYEK